MSEPLYYKASGVDIDAANSLKRSSRRCSRTTTHASSMAWEPSGRSTGIGFPEMSDPVLVLKTEEPGSKQLLAIQHDRFESIGHDMINHLINDCIVMGARPLAVQDAIICGKLEKDKVKRMIAGIDEACRAQGCTLTGGEISEQPAVIEAGRYILTSSIVGIVDRPDVIDGSAIRAGDAVLAVESSGLHTNGYSLVRKLLARNPGLERWIVGGPSFIDLALEPHRCYYNYLKDLFPQKIIRGMAHITGGGIRENLDRVLPPAIDALIDLNAYRVPAIFSVIRDESGVDDSEMLRTFNLGVGLAIVCAPGDAGTIVTHLQKKGLPAWRIGETVQGEGKVLTRGEPAWN